MCIISDEIKLKIHKFVDYLNSSNDLEKFKINDFNILKMLGLERKELIHSKILAYFLDPKENHGLGDKFVKLFFANILNKSANNFEDVVVYTEIPFRIDICLLNRKEKYVLAIENKIDSDLHDSGDGECQLITYKKKIEKQFPKEQGFTHRYILLSPSEFNVGYEGWEQITYKDIIIIFKNLREHASTNVKLFIDNYIEILEKEIIRENECSVQCQKIYEDNKEAIDFIMSHINDEKIMFGNLVIELFNKISKENNKFIFNKTKERVNISFQTEWLKKHFQNNRKDIYYKIYHEDYSLYLIYPESLKEDVKKYIDIIKNKSKFMIGSVNREYVRISKLNKDFNYLEDLERTIEIILKAEEQN